MRGRAWRLLSYLPQQPTSSSCPLLHALLHKPDAASYDSIYYFYRHFSSIKKKKGQYGKVAPAGLPVIAATPTAIRPAILPSQGERTDTTTISCLVHSQPSENVFEVKIRKESSVSALKDLILTKKPHFFQEVDASDLKLWRVSIPEDDEEKLQQFPPKDSEKLRPLWKITRAFPQELHEGHINVIIETPQQGRVPQRKSDDLGKNTDIRDTSSLPPYKCFKPSGTVYPEYRKYVYYADQTANNAPLINAIVRGDFLRMYGPRASGKSSRVVDAMTELEAKGYECIYIDLQSVSISSVEKFWTDLNRTFKQRARLPSDFTDVSTFIASFAPNERWDRPVVLFFDEFDKIHSDTATEVCDSVLTTIRALRNDPTRGKDNQAHVIHSISSIGTFSILEPEQKNEKLSLFNAAEGFSGESLTRMQVFNLFKKFGEDRAISIDSTVIEDIFQLTNGHAGLVNVCGAAIQDDLLPLENHMLNLAHWQGFVPSLLNNVLRYSTFWRMVKSLSMQKNAVELLRSWFLGNFDEFVFVPLDQIPVVRYLAALGVLSPDRTGLGFKMISPIVDSLIRQHVIPALYPAAPSKPIPVQPGGRLNIPEVLKEALKFFDKETIERATCNSYKTANVKVDGVNGLLVPRESVYDSELMRVLAVWLRRGLYRVTGQWNHLDRGSHRYSDIVVEKRSFRTVLELLATEKTDSIDEHIKRVSDYKINLSAQEAWVIHFTRADNILKDPYWQSDELLDKNIYIAHIWHNRDFTEVRMSTKWKSWDGENKSISDERII